MTNDDLRARIELQKCRIKAAEATYDVKTVIKCLKRLSEPLMSNVKERVSSDVGGNYFLNKFKSKWLLAIIPRILL
jgi:hypothetical protein